MSTTTATISNTFIWRRLHSLMGLWLILYLVEHLIVNSQAALWIGDDGSGFISLVNSLESLPYLQVIEWIFIGVPFAIHGIWGVKRALTPKLNSYSSDGSSPSMKYGRNKAFTWQRLTSWILLIGVLGHVVQMRFLNYPKEARLNNQEQYLTPVTFDEGLYTLAGRLNTHIYTREEISNLKAQSGPVEEVPKVSLIEGVRPADYMPEKEKELNEIQKAREMKKWIKKLSSFHLKEHQVVIGAESPGKAMLFMVRDTFKSPTMVFLYSIFVLAAAFHAFNGFWTSLITWGVILSYRSQKAMIPIGWLGIALLGFLGLAAIWGSYWINLRT